VACAATFRIQCWHSTNPPAGPRPPPPLRGRRYWRPSTPVVEDHYGADSAAAENISGGHRPSLPAQAPTCAELPGASVRKRRQAPTSAEPRSASAVKCRQSPPPPTLPLHAGSCYIWARASPRFPSYYTFVRDPNEDISRSSKRRAHRSSSVWRLPALVGASPGDSALRRVTRRFAG